MGSATVRAGSRRVESTTAVDRQPGRPADREYAAGNKLAHWCVWKTTDATFEVTMRAEHADFTDFFRARYEPFLRAMYLVTGDRYEAEELGQDTFVKACERWDRVRGMDNPIGYLYRTAVNAHRSTLRRARGSARRALSLQPSDPISESDDRDRIRRALATLPANQREAVVLVEWCRG
jgi:RNA polymerase sigma factor (sigma-70 family)